MGVNSHFQKTTFPVEFSDKKCTLDRVRQVMIKKVEKSVPFQNAGHFTDFPSTWSLNTTKIEKQLSQKWIPTEFSQK